MYGVLPACIVLVVVVCKVFLTALLVSTAAVSKGFYLSKVSVAAGC